MQGRNPFILNSPVPFVPSKVGVRINQSWMQMLGEDVLHFVIKSTDHPLKWTGFKMQVL